MATVVENVPHPGFMVSPLTTSSGAVVYRRRVKVTPQKPVTYGHVGQNTNLSTITFDIQDPECFMDTKSLVFNAKFTPSALVIGEYPAHLDGSTQSLVLRLRIGNSQGLLIEDIVRYNLYTGLIESYTANNVYKNDAVWEFSSNKKGNGQGLMGAYDHSQQLTQPLLDISSTTMSLVNSITAADVSATRARDIQIRFHQSSFLNRIRFFPLFLMKNGLRIEFEFERPSMAFYVPTFGSVVGDRAPDHVITCTGWTTTEPAATMTLVTGAGTISGFLDGEDTGTANNGIIDVIHKATGKRLVRVPFSKLAYDSASGTITATIPAIVFTANYNGAAVPVIAHIYWLSKTEYDVCADSSTPAWNYTISDPYLMVDYVKPSSEVMMSYINMWKSPAGIPYSFSRLAYHQQYVPSGAATPLQINLPWNLRSLKGVIVAITDNAAINESAATFKFPTCSTGQMRGLIEAQLSIGAAQFPGFALQFNNQYALQQLEELMLLLGTHMSTNTPSIKPHELDRAGTNFSWATVPTRGLSTFAAAATATKYLDTSKFLLGISCMKYDGDLVSGVDTSQSGAVTLNLRFIAHEPETTARPFYINIWGIHDAICTLQESGVTVRV